MITHKSLFGGNVKTRPKRKTGLGSLKYHRKGGEIDSLTAGKFVHDPRGNVESEDNKQDFLVAIVKGGARSSVHRSKNGSKKQRKQ